MAYFNEKLNKIVPDQVGPNSAHFQLAELEKALKESYHINTALHWRETIQGHKFWEDYNEGRNQVKGKQAIQAMLDNMLEGVLTFEQIQEKLLS